MSWPGASPEPGATTFDGHSTFGRDELADDEMLLVTVHPQACRHRSFYLGSEFQQTLPYGEGYGLVTRETVHDEAPLPYREPTTLNEIAQR